MTPRCYFCNLPMRWESDFNYDEVWGEGEGIVSFWTCPECGGEAQYSLRDDVEEDLPNEYYE